MEDQRVILTESAFDLDFLVDIPKKRTKGKSCYKILIADDDREVHSITEIMLKDFEFEGKGICILKAYSGSEAKELLRENPDIAVAFLDVVMEDNASGLHVVEYLRKELKNGHTRIILRTGQPGEAPEERIVRDYDINDYRLKTEMTIQRLNTSLYTALRAYRDIEENKNLNTLLQKTQEEIIFTLGEIIENHFEETAGHVRRAAEIMEILSSGLGRSKRECEMIKIASTMHDVGKVAIPDAILKKPGKLTPEEFEQMKKHAEIGYRILAKSDLEIFKMAAIIARGHHEKFDGSGYPHGLKGKDIPLNARMMAVVDVFDAILSKRCYKDADTFESAISYMEDQRGTHFDPEIVDVFLKNIEKVRELY